MKKRILVIYIVGMLLATSFFSVIAMNTVKMIDDKVEVNDAYTDGDVYKYTRYDNEVYFGEIWSINREKSFGSVDISVNEEVSDDWVVEGDFAYGIVKLRYYSLISSLGSLSNNRLSTYTVRVYDGPSTSDPELLTQEKMTLENTQSMGDILDFPIDIPTKGETSRDLAYVVTGETKLILNLIKIPIKEPRSNAGNKKIEGTFHVNFISNKKKLITKPENQPCTNNNTLDLDFGTILVYADPDPAKRNYPRISIEGMLKEYGPFTINCSEDINVSAWVNCSIDLPKRPTPIPILPFITGKVLFYLGGGFPIGNESIKLESFNESMIPLSITQWNETFHCIFSVNPQGLYEPYLVFWKSCDIYWHPFPIWDIHIPPIRGDPHKSSSCIVKLDCEE